MTHHANVSAQQGQHEKQAQQAQQAQQDPSRGSGPGGASAVQLKLQCGLRRPARFAHGKQAQSVTGQSHLTTTGMRTSKGAFSCYAMPGLPGTPYTHAASRDGRHSTESSYERMNRQGSYSSVSWFLPFCCTPHAAWLQGARYFGD